MSQHLLSLSQLRHEQIESIFTLAANFQKNKIAPIEQKSVVALVFFEPSTRTRMSFEMAALRLGFKALCFDRNSSSLEKGETLEDSLLNIAALGPELLVVRCGDDLALDQVPVKVPVINGGWGKKGHPSQALLDVFTFLQLSPKIAGKKLLLMGDVRHSRVAASHMELSAILNYQIATFTKEEFSLSTTLHNFQNDKEALAWADYIMCLRVQSERHENSHSTEGFNQKYGLNESRLNLLTPQQRIFHPGPINHGIEMSKMAFTDSRSMVLDQVANGVFIRQAIIDLKLRGLL